MPMLARIETTSVPAQQLAGPETDDRSYVRLGLAVLLLTFGVLLGWAAIAPLQSAVVAGGRLVAASQNKTVQHVDGGQVAEILVADGDRVSAGQPLLRLDDSALRIRLHNIRGQLLEQQANLVRLEAERREQDRLVFPDELQALAASEGGGGALETQQTLFSSRRQAAASEREVLEQRAKQASAQIQSLGASIATLRQRVRLLDRDLAGLRKLNADRLVSETKVRELQRRRMELLGDIAEREGEVARLRESVAENQRQGTLRQKEFQREVAGSLRETRAQLMLLEANRETVQDKLSRVEITAPASGRIKGFDIVTPGAVIRAGEAIMEIVPAEASFRIHARVSPMDVDALHPGMQAEVRLPAIDGARNFPVIYAGLEAVSADAFDGDPGGTAHYRVTLALSPEGLRVLADEGARLVPGMPVEVYVKTGERTFLDYLTRPLQDVVARALNEA